MPGASKPLRVVLIQVRERADVAEHERQCVLEQGRLEPEQLRWLNVIDEPSVPMEKLDGDVVLIGGAGVHSVTDHHAFSDRLGEVVLRLAQQGRPMLGLCWGHQFIAQALGGSVITDEDRFEVGTHTLELTQAGASDPITGDCPLRFEAHMGHHDRVDRLPPGGVELAFTELCRNQGFRIEGSAIYGFQFHIEMSVRRLRERLEVYQAQYLADEPAISDDDERLRPTPEANALLVRFFEHFAS